MKRIIALGVAALVIAGCGSSQNTSLDTSPGAYPAALQGTLVGGCSGAVDASSQNFPSGYCECALKQLEANLTASQANGGAYVDGQSMITDPDILSACK